MKKILLFFAVLFIFHFALRAQTQNFERKGVVATNTEMLSVYPNPASDYIAVNNDENVKAIEVFSLVGRRVRSFEVERAGEHYDISDLPNSVYFIHLIGKSNEKPLLTLRLTKKS